MSLQGITVLVTRPSPQGDILCEKIRNAGGNAVHLPTIAIAPPNDVLLLHQQLSTLEQQDIIIFISPQAVYQTAPWLDASQPNLSRSTIIALGEGTAKALRNLKIPLASMQPNDWHSEGLLALPVLQSIHHKKIALIKGDKGRTLIESTLKERGAFLTTLIAYQRVLPKMAMEAYQDLLHRNEIDIIICTSNEILQNLLTLLDSKGLNAAQKLPIIVISERMRLQADQCGFHHQILAPNASDDALISVLLKEKDRLCQMKRKKT